MGKFSDQIRHEIQNCGVSSYVLARSADVSESTLSRFLNGESGLTLETLDRLAEVLGLHIAPRANRLPQPKGRGRKQTRVKTMLTVAKKTNWNKVAENIAKEAYEEHFSSHRGIWFLEEIGKLGIYNSHPYPEPFKHIRGWEIAEFQRWLREAGVKELGYATYPPADQDDPGYTYAMILDAGEERLNEVVDAYNNVLQRSSSRRTTDSK